MLRRWSVFRKKYVNRERKKRAKFMILLFRLQPKLDLYLFLTKYPVLLVYVCDSDDVWWNRWCTTLFFGVRNFTHSLIEQKWRFTTCKKWLKRMFYFFFVFILANNLLAVENKWTTKKKKLNKKLPKWF